MGIDDGDEVSKDTRAIDTLLNVVVQYVLLRSVDMWRIKTDEVQRVIRLENEDISQTLVGSVFVRLS